MDIAKAFDVVDRSWLFNELVKEAAGREEYLGHRRETQWLKTLFKLVKTTYMEIGAGKDKQTVECTNGVP